MLILAAELQRIAAEKRPLDGGTAAELRRMITVSDNGPGLSQEVLANLFSAVRSTKDGAHHGLGLSIVHGLVKKIGGLISCRSSRAGTTFEILLPAHGAHSHAGAKPRAMDSV